MKKKNITDSLVRTVSIAAGAAGSNIAAEHLPIKNNYLKRGSLILAGLLGAAYAGRKSTSKAFAQDLATGVAATQAFAMIKEGLSEKTKENKLVKSALGSPGSYNDPVQVDFRMGYVTEDFFQETIDVAHQDVSFTM